jgi:hypothetical protein
MSQVQDNTRLYRGQGQVFLGKKLGSGHTGLEFIGNVTELMLNPKTEKIEHMESQTGYNSVDKVIERALKVELSMTTDSMTRQNLDRLLFGKTTVSSASTVTNEVQTAYAGKLLTLDNIRINTFTSLTPAAGGTPYVLGTDYEIVDLAAGMIKALVGGAISALGTSVRANYSTGVTETVAAFGSPNTEYWLRFNGLNSAEDDNPVVVDCFKVRFAPTSDLPLIGNDKFAEFKQSGDCLFDATQPVDGKLGRYFSVRQLFVGN